MCGYTRLCMYADFGPLGVRGHDVVQHFQAIADVSPIPPRMNVATWVVEIVAQEEAEAKKGGNPAARKFQDVRGWPG